MPDHFHLLLTVAQGMPIERAVQFVKGGFAFRAGEEIGVRAPFWQKGFSEVRIVDAAAFRRAAEYIHQNPVVAHLVEDAKAFPYSSACHGFEIDPPPAWMKIVSPARSA